MKLRVEQVLSAHRAQNYPQPYTPELLRYPELIWTLFWVDGGVRVRAALGSMMQRASKESTSLTLRIGLVH